MPEDGRNYTADLKSVSEMQTQESASATLLSSAIGSLLQEKNALPLCKKKILCVLGVPGILRAIEETHVLMGLSKIKILTTIAFLVIVVIQGSATTMQPCATDPLQDSLYLPPLHKFVGNEVQSLLVLIDSDNYETFYIRESKGVETGIILQFKTSGLSLHIYCTNNDPGGLASDRGLSDLEKIKNQKITRIEIYNEQKFVTLFDQGH